MKQDILNSLDEVLEQRKQARPDESYTAKLFSDGLDSILKKVGEEAIETVIASKSGKNVDIIHEIADLWFHTLVLLKHHGLDSNDVLKELEGRFGLSGLEEKANRNKSS
jgi:phosphoribosyl-ATP pyrophosphohydrolase